MLNLLICILLNTYLVICLKAFGKYKVDTFQAIVINYFVCIVTGSLYDGKAPDYAGSFHQPWFFYAVYMGSAFFVLFILMGYITRTMGATVTSVAGKLSMVIPVTSAFFLYREPVTVIKITAVALAIVSVMLSSIKEDKNTHLQSGKYLLFPVILFIGSGINDTLSKYCQETYLTENEFSTFNIIVFSVAAFVGFMALAIQLFIGKRIERRTVIAGIALGIPNFFSLQFLLITLSTEGWDSSVIFPLNNIGILVATVAFAFVLFREKLSKLNWIGLAVGLVAIGIMI